VLKHHDTGGSEITASLKHMYGVVTMADGQSGIRHYSRLGETCGKMIASVRTPVLNIVDAIWVSHSSLGGYPVNTTFRTNQLLASQDPVAADYWAAKYILHPVNSNPRHHPDFSGIDRWLTQARDTINKRGGLLDPENGVLVDRVTKDEAEMRAHTSLAGDFLNNVRLSVSRSGLHFNASVGEARTLEKFLSISVSGANALTWRIETDASWLNCVPTSGSGNQTVAVFAHTVGLEPGRHTGRIIIRCPGAANTPLAVSVVLNLFEQRRRIDNRSKSKF
jgi:hypothetical protein